MSAINRDADDPQKLYFNTSRFMENVIMEFLRAVFMTFPDEDLRWSPDAETSRIVIEGRSTDNTRDIDTRPKIVVMRGTVGWQNRGIGNFVGSANLSQFRQTFADVEDGTVGVSCFSREDLESDTIAQIVYNAIKMSRTVLQRLGFLTIRSAQLGQRGLIKSDSRPELWVTPVVAMVQTTKNWTVRVSDPIKMREEILSQTTNI